MYLGIHIIFQKEQVVNITTIDEDVTLADIINW